MSATDRDRETERKLKKQRAESQAAAERDALVKHIQEQDHRLHLKRLEKKAAVQRRQREEYDPKPARRKMYDDHSLSLAAQVPGPGTYTPRMQAKDSSSGVTFGAQPFASVSGSSSAFDRDSGSPDAWKVKAAAQQPGPASYTPARQRTVCGTTFGLPPALGGSKKVPSAHDMSKMVAHLRDLPAPDAYSPRQPTKNQGFRMVPSKAMSSLEHVIKEATKVPGPGRYDLSASLSGGRSTVIANGGQVKSELDVIQARARQVPGPGAYPHHSQLRSKGSPRFSSAGGLSLIEAIQLEARVSVQSRLPGVLLCSSGAAVPSPSTPKVHAHSVAHASADKARTRHLPSDAHVRAGAPDEEIPEGARRGQASRLSERSGRASCEPIIRVRMPFRWMIPSGVGSGAVGMWMCALSRRVGAGRSGALCFFFLVPSPRPAAHTYNSGVAATMFSALASHHSTSGHWRLGSRDRSAIAIRAERRARRETRDCAAHRYRSHCQCHSPSGERREIGPRSHESDVSRRDVSPSQCLACCDVR